MLAKLAEGIAVEGMESLTPACWWTGGMQSVLDLLPDRSLVVLVDPERVRTRAHDLVATSEEFLEASWVGAAAGSAVAGRPQGVLGTASFWTLAELREHARARRPAVVDADVVRQRRRARRVQRIRTRATTSSSGSTSRPATSSPSAATPRRPSRSCAAGSPTGWRVVVVTDGHGLARRVARGPRRARRRRRRSTRPATRSRPASCTSRRARSGRGFVDAEQRLAVVTEADLTGQPGGSGTKDMRRMPSRRRNQVDPLQLRPGDYVVHEQHGVGRFVEMVQRTVQERDARVPRHRVRVVEARPARPTGCTCRPTSSTRSPSTSAARRPRCNKLGGSDWHKTKARARRYVKEIAAELIRLYSARMATKGHAFGPDTPWQRELEDAFAYVETPDQLSTIDEVKADMEKAVPMDRLICGDVGYGKTEIAVRAAFKAVQDGKQVAVLVPTTLLVTQHFDTFSERYAPFPVNGQGAEPVPVRQGGPRGPRRAGRRPVDVVIGTHRLLSADVRFKDLGLVVVDEEQRFGVEHKEQLKKLRTDVDVLAMSATPIPRTLEMAVTGIREMSTLATPPEERHPVLTYVGGYEEKQITAAIRRELLREGQVFYVHNRVESIERAAVAAARARARGADRRRPRPDERAPAGAGDPRLLGEAARRPGLHDDHRDRARHLQRQHPDRRAGRRARPVPAAPAARPRGPRARARIRVLHVPAGEAAHRDRARPAATIASHTDLGAGMQVAMKDLEIRGAGNLLGGEQSGHIEGVGFDLYVRLVGEAVADFKGEGETRAPAEIKIELPVDAHLPHDYVPGERLRLEAYRKLAAVVDEEELAEVEAELARPLRRAARAGREPARGRPAADRRAGGRRRRHRHAGHVRAVRAGRRCGRASSCA